MNKKTDLRIIAKNIRKTLNILKISADLVSLIQKNEVYKNAQNVMLFYPTKYEVNLLGLLSDDKNFFLPKVKGENLLVCPYKNGDTLVQSEFNIYEPITEPISPANLDLVIVPALMADKNGFRLGYGGGFYDRFLKENKKYFKTICPISKELYIESLPINEFDEQIDMILIT